MKKYPLDPWGIDQYLYAVNDTAYRLLNKRNNPWCFGTDPVYPLKWYITTGRSSAQWLKVLLSIRPDVIARKLIEGGSDQEVMTRINSLVQKRMEV